MTDSPFETDAATGPVSTAASAPDKGRPARQPGNGGRQRPQRGTHPVLEKLFELHPKLFGARFLPLKLGTYEDLIARHPDAFKPEELKVAMGLHARSARYLESVAAGHPRHDLDGNAVEPVAPEHVHHAIVELHRRRQNRTGDDLRPQLVDRVAQAIETSGLDREAYTMRVHANSEEARALLDDAFGEWGRRVARREALLRAFEQSGKSVAEFADMYGLDRADVTRAVAAKRVPAT